MIMLERVKILHEEWFDRGKPKAKNEGVTQVVVVGKNGAYDITLLKNGWVRVREDGECTTFYSFSNVVWGDKVEIYE